jgi:hypothetical protein
MLLKKNPVIVPTSPQYGVARAQSSTTINCHAQKVRIRSPSTVWTKKIKKLLSNWKQQDVQTCCLAGTTTTSLVSVPLSLRSESIEVALE